MELEKIRKSLPKIEIIENANMAEHTSFKAGGQAACLCVVKSVEELKGVLSFTCSEGIDHFILGNGTNVLFRDGIYDGIVIKMDGQSEEFGGMKLVSRCGSTKSDFLGQNSTNPDELAENLTNPDELTENSTIPNRSTQNSTNLDNPKENLIFNVGASALLSTFARFVVSNEVSAKGMEALSGIPGSIGGAVFMNAGAYGSEIKDVVKSVHAVSPDGKEEKDFTNAEMDFGYRHSLLMKNGYIVTSATFELEQGEYEEIKALMDEYRMKRNTKQPVQYPSAGSTFKRPEGYFAGKLIEDSNLKGLSVGGATVSMLHAGFIINENNATATDIINLITLVKNTVYDKFGVELEPEVRII